MPRPPDCFRLLSRGAAFAAAAILLAATAGSPARAAAKTLRVCAAANNLPYSNRARQGFENKLATLIAKQLAETVSYTWRARPRGLVRRALDAGACDVVLGVPTQLASVETTRPYYWSSYVFVTRADRHIDITSIKDPRLRPLRIGVESIDGNSFFTPPARMLADSGLAGNVVGYPAGGTDPDRRERIINAVAQGRIDIAAVWGPVGGYFARRSPAPLTIAPIADYEMFSTRLLHFGLAAFQYDISMGVRKGDNALRDALDRAIAATQPQITAVLQRFGVPLIDRMRTAALGRYPGGPAR